MWIRHHSKVYRDVKKDSIWRLWIDVNNWTTWHGDLDFCKMDEPFAVGSHFYLKPKGVAPVRIEITEIKEGASFTDCTIFFGAKMFDTPELEATPEGLRLTNTLTVKGPLSFLWAKLVAENVAKTVPEENDALVKLARSEE